MRHQIWCRVILLQQVVLQYSRFLSGHPQYISSLKWWLLDDNKLQFSTLCSVAFQLTKESGATQIQDSQNSTSWRNQLISQRVNSRSHYLYLCFGADILLQQLQLFHQQFWFLEAAIIYSKFFKYQVWDSIYMFGSLELSTNQLSFDELDNNIYFPSSEASATATTPSSTTIFTNQGVLHQSSLYTHQENYLSFDIFSTVWWIIVTDFITNTSTSSALTSLPLLMDDYVFASGCFRYCRLVISPSRLTYYANAGERLRHYHWLLHCYWLDHRHRHLYQYPAKPLQHSLFYCCLMGNFVLIVDHLCCCLSSLLSVVFVVADYFLHLHDWWISSSPLMRVYIFTVGLLSSPPTGILAFTDGLLCRH